jgi:hypothetical protein
VARRSPRLAWMASALLTSSLCAVRRARLGDGLERSDRAFATGWLAGSTSPSCTKCSSPSTVVAKVEIARTDPASTAFTMDAYQHVLPTMGEAVAAAIEKALRGKIG